MSFSLSISFLLICLSFSFSFKFILSLFSLSLQLLFFSFLFLFFSFSFCFFLLLFSFLIPFLHSFLSFPLSFLRISSLLFFLFSSKTLRSGCLAVLLFVHLFVSFHCKIWICVLFHFSFQITQLFPSLKGTEPGPISGPLQWRSLMLRLKKRMAARAG